MGKVITIDLLKEGKMLPPKPDVCQMCAVKHQPEEPHNQQSMYWQYWFRRQHDRWPTWKDAMEHCSPEVKEAWITALKAYGVEV